MLPGWRWAHEPFHSVIEVSGSFIAFMIVPLLLSLGAKHEGTSFNNQIAAALIGMGVIDAGHAMVHVGQLFVWLHSTASFVGGALFALVCLPITFGRRFVVIVAVLSVAFCLLSLGFPELVPTMVKGGRFSVWAMGLNVAGGVLFLLAAARLFWSYRRTGNEDDLLFVIHCGLFGAAAIMFEQSALWDVAWWGWHALRFGAYAVALYFVLTKFVEFDRQLTRFTGELQDANAQLERFAFVASHDLQEPLRKIMAFGSILREDHADVLDEDGRQTLGVMVDAAARMRNLVRDILAYSRLGSREQELSLVAVADCVEAAKNNLNESIASSGATISCGELPHLRADKQQITQLFQNLVGNGIKYQRRGVTPRIEVGVRERQGDAVVLFVRDNGIGIDGGHLQMIFQPFKRLHSRQEYPGTGIGLAICEKVAQRHGGGITAESIVGEGTTFIIELLKDPPSRV